MGEKILITGANRGLGFVLAKFLVEGDNEVFATCRQPISSKLLSSLKMEHPKINVITMDIDSEESIKKARIEVEGKASHLDIVINNAGIHPSPYDAKLEDLDFRKVLAAFQTNTLGALRTAKAFLGLIRKSSKPRIINVSSEVGSIGHKNYPNFYAYAISKTALNMFTRTFAIEVKEEGIICVSICPGWTKTEMGGPNGKYTPEESGIALIKIINNLRLDQTGKFLNRDGNEISW